MSDEIPSDYPEGWPALQRLKRLANSLLPGKRWLLVLAVFLVVALLVLGGMFERLELNIYDAWFRLNGVQNPGSQVVIVAMDDASTQLLGPLSWPRSVQARLLEKLKEARVVGFDLLFDLATKPAEDKALGDAVAKQGRVVLGTHFLFTTDAAGNRVEEFERPQPEIMAGAAGLGFVNTPTDIDNVIRHVTLVDVNFFKVPFPALGLAVGMTAIGLSPDQLHLAGGRLIAGNRVIPLDSKNMALPCFWGPQGTFKTYSYADVVTGKVPEETFRDKIVLIGPTSPVAHDYFPTPFTSSNLVLSAQLPSPGVEIHASVVQSFLDGRWYRRFPAAGNLALLFLIGLLTALIIARRSPWQGLLLMLVTAGAVTGAAFLLWRYDRLWINLAAPLTLILLTYGSMTATDYLQAELGRRHTREMFGRYVSPAVVEELMRDPDKVALGGQRQMVSVMFCDIRGFTSYSENKPPEEVVQRLNQYLTAMSHVILRLGGTLDKYLGDGLMAIFGAPIFYPDHVQRALQAAVEIQQEVRQLNQVWAAQGAQPLNVGVGINSGSVLVGNVGSPERMDYTVIGEDVNLASRVEGLTKTFGTLIIISERSVNLLDEALQQSLGLRYVGQAEVKGFTLPVGVYTVGDYGME